MKVKEFLKKYVAIVVILVALLVAGTNYLIYPLFIKKQLNIVTVPIATEKIGESTKITEDMIEEMEIIDGYLPENVVTDKEKLVGLYVKQGCVVATKGFFYTEFLANEKQTLGTIYSNLKENEYAYNLAVDDRWTKNGNIQQGQTINLYFTYSYLDEQEIVHNVFGQLAENVRVIAVSEEKTVLTLAVPEEDLAYIKLTEEIIAQCKDGVSHQIIPMAYFDSANNLSYNTEYYDIQQTRSWINDTADTIRKEQMIVGFEDVTDETVDVSQVDVTAQGAIAPEQTYQGE